MTLKNLRIINLLAVLVMLFTGTLAYAQNNKINGVRVWPSPQSTRVVLDLSQKPEYSYFMLKNPRRLVIDVKDTQQLKTLPSIPKEHAVVKRIRYSTPKQAGSTRLVFELTEQIKPVIFALAPTGPYQDRLVVDLYRQEKNLAKKPVVSKARKLSQERDIVIAIDAGHGGEDPGSIGPSGTYEKNITLSIAKRVKRLVDKEPGMRAVLIRSGDYYVKLGSRSNRARQHKADFLISIHADAFRTPQPRGASVWVLSLRRANTETGRWLENKEKHSELLGGAADVIKDAASEKYLARALLDMSMDHSMKTGYQVAEEVIKEMKKVTKMHKRTPQAASLAVLKSPDIPSILVETGFISNPKEEALLKTASHQAKLARAVFNSVKNHFAKNPPEDSLFAKLHGNKPRTHKVRRGESLSVLANRYGVSVGALKKANRLRKDVLYVGQVITIPRS